MSDANSQLLNFVCPKCQKRLRAPANLAGQKLACPKCSSPIRVPGVVETSKDEDDWLSLGESEKPASATLPPQKSRPKAESKQPSTSADPKPEPAQVKKSNPLDRQELNSPKNKAPIESESDDLLLAPPEPDTSSGRPKASVSSDSAAKSTTAKSIFDDDLPELAPLEDLTSNPRDVSAVLGDVIAQAESNPKPSLKPNTKSDLPLPDVPLPELSLDTPALVGEPVPLNDEEFTFACKVCGSRLSSKRSKVGSNLNCPDCYTKLKVPPPPKKAKQVEVKMVAEAASVTFAPVDALNVRDPRNAEVKAKDILKKAEQAIEDERDEFVDGTFDTKRWMGFLFGFLRDPMVIAVAAISGFATGLWFFAIAAVGTWLPLEGAQILIAQLVLFCVFSIPITLFICMCGIAILAMTANRLNRVQEWPFTKFTESLSECAMVIVSVLIAGIPGGMVGGVFNSLNAHPIVSLAFALIGIWGLTPILLLSMIDNSAILEPYSKAVWQSIRSRPEAWGAMYMQTGLAFGMFLILMLVVGTAGPVGDFVIGFLLPIACFFLFSQYGVLAGRISDITEMGFEGDFSED